MCLPLPMGGMELLRVQPHLERRSRCGALPRCSPRPWARVGRFLLPPRSGRLRSTRLDAKRKALNAQLNERGLKVSFTHLIAWAIVQAAKEWPVMVRSFEEREGKPFAIEDGPVNLGIAVDIERKDGSRSLMVPAIKGADGLDFAAFRAYYEDLITKTRESKLTADDFQGTNISLTNPGGIGTVASVPRLMKGQSAIVAAGAIAYPPEWAHATEDRLRRLGVSKTMTLTSTYDHRVIQGAESGAFLRRIERCSRARTASTRRSPPTSASTRRRSPPPTPPRPRRRRSAPRRRPPAPAPPTRSCSAPSRPPPRCSRATAPTATSPPASTRSAASRRATPRSSPRTST